MYIKTKRTSDIINRTRDNLITYFLDRPVGLLLLGKSSII